MRDYKHPIDRFEVFDLREKHHWNFQAIADKYGVTRQNISLILNKLSRKPFVVLKCACGAYYKVFLRGSRPSSCDQCSQPPNQADANRRRYHLCRCGRRKYKQATTCAACGNRRSKLNVPLVLWLYGQGYSIPKIATYFSSVVSNVHQTLLRNGIQVRTISAGHIASRKAIARMSITDAANQWKKKHAGHQGRKGTA